MKVLLDRGSPRANAQRDIAVLQALCAYVAQSDDDEGVARQALLMRKLVDLAPVGGVTDVQLRRMLAAFNLVERMAFNMKAAQSAEARLAKLQARIRADGAEANDENVAAEFAIIEGCVAQADRGRSRSLRRFHRVFGSGGHQHLQVFKPCVTHRRPRRMARRRRSSHAAGARGSGSSDDGDPEPPPHPAKVFGPDDPRRQPPSDGYHRPRTFAGRDLAITCVLDDAGRELP
jgi:hypothetical protein